MRAGLLRRRDMLPPCAQARFAVAVITVLSSHKFLLLLLLLMVSVYGWEKNGSRCGERNGSGNGGMLLGGGGGGS